MKFSSMRTYFYKLHNVLYVAILIPLLTFTYLYLEIQAGRPPVTQPHTIAMYLAICGFGVLFTLSYRRFLQKIKPIRQLTGLGVKLEQYAALSIARFVLLGAGCVLLVVGYYLTTDQLFIVLFMVSLIVFSLWWPSPGKVCKDLRLKGDEREMVFHKRDSPEG